jgi:hypothetical protein
MQVYIANLKLDESKYIIAYNCSSQSVFLILNTLGLPTLNLDFICDKCDIPEILVNYYETNTIKICEIEIGKAYLNIWKPGLNNPSIPEQLGYNAIQKNRAKRDLSILVQKLQEILLYVEPTKEGLSSYSHKTRELLLLASTEVENCLRQYISDCNADRAKTKDYVNILDKIDLKKYKITFNGYSEVFSCKPFELWNKEQPTQSIVWYDAYNKTKHNKDKYFNLATLENVLYAVAACVVMFCIRYSPHAVYSENDFYSNLIRNFIDVSILDIKETDIYIPKITATKGYSGVYSRSKNFINGKCINDIYDIPKFEFMQFE